MIEKVITCFADNNKEKEIYYNVTSLKEAAWLFLQDHPREGEHKILVKEKAEHYPIKYTYATSDLRNYKKVSFKKRTGSWHYNKEGESVEGPISSEELIKKIQTKSISKNTLVWKGGMNDWEKIHKVSNFESFFTETTPPPLPRNSHVKKETVLERPEEFVEKTEDKRSPKKNTVSKEQDKQTSKEKSEQTNRWLKFYVRFRIPFGIFILIINSFYPPNFVLPSEESTFRIITLCFVIAYSILFWGLHKRKLWGWKFNWIFIFFEPILGGFGAANEPGQAIIFIGLGLVIYSLPNYLYFNKRRHLFIE